MHWFVWLPILPRILLSLFPDPNERRIAGDPATVPTTPEALEAAYKKSDIFKRMLAEREDFKKLIEAENGRQKDFVAAVKDDKRRGVSNKSPYTVSFYTQVQALTVRQYVLCSRRWDRH